MFTYTLTIIYRYVYPNVNILYGIILNADLSNADWLDKLITISPLVGGFFLGVGAAVYFYERQQKNEKTQAAEVNKKIKELSEQHVEEFKTLSEQQLQRYDKEMAAKDEQIKAKDIANKNLVDLWHKAIQNGIDAKEKAVLDMRGHYESLLSKKDKIIEEEKIYIRENEAEMKKSLMDLKHVTETISLLKEYKGVSEGLSNKLEKLSTTIELLYKKLEHK